MLRQTYARATLLVSLALGGVYIINVLYSRAISNGTITAISSFQGLSGVQQVVLLLIMSVFFAITIMLRSNTDRQPS